MLVVMAGGAGFHGLSQLVVMLDPNSDVETYK